MTDDQDETLNDDAVNAPFPTRDQLKALIARREDLLDLMDKDEDKDWMKNANNELREALRAVASEERKVDAELKAASATLRRDFELGMD